MLALKDPSLLRQAALVGDRWIYAAQTGIAVTNPSTGATLGHVPDLTPAHAEAAIAAAALAQRAWAARTAKDRGQFLRRWYDLMMAHQDDLATILTAEQGKPLAEARGEIAYGASFIGWFAEEARRAYGDIVPGARARPRPCPHIPRLRGAGIWHGRRQHRAGQHGRGSFWRGQIFRPWARRVAARDG